MTNVADIFSARACPVSFEMFPPKGELALDAARSVMAELAQLAPDFVSVTYSAGGSGNSQATADVAAMVQSEFGIPAVAHLTCGDATLETLDAAISGFKAHGVETVLALRGDRAPNAGSAFGAAAGAGAAASGMAPDAGSAAAGDWAGGPSGREPAFRFAKDLIPHLAQAGFCVGAAAYPEGHVACFDARANIEHLKQKQDAGASFFVTQLFFDNACFYRFREAAEAAGVTAPIACGVMPLLSKAQVQRMVFMCGASLPSALVKLVARYEDAPDDLRRAGIEYACAQLADLRDCGARGLHVYTMNQPDIARACVAALRGGDATRG